MNRRQSVPTVLSFSLCVVFIYGSKWYTGALTP